MKTKDPFGSITESHRALLDRLDAIEKLLGQLQYKRPDLIPRHLEVCRTICGFIDQEVAPHMAREDGILLPFLESHLPKFQGPIAVLKMEHGDLRSRERELKRAMEKLETAGENPQSDLVALAEELCSYIVFLLKNHVRQEQDIIYRSARQMLTPGEKEALLEALEGGACGLAR